MSEINKDQIAHMEDEFLKLQRIELSLKEKNSKLKKLLEFFGLKASTYDSPRKINKLIKEIEGIIDNIAKTGRVRGKAMSMKTMNEYLAKSERAAHTQRVLDSIDRANTKRAELRMSLYVDELLKEKNIVMADIDLMKTRGAIAGFSSGDILKNLVRDASNDSGPIPAFGKRMETIETAILRREATATEIDEYRKVAAPDEEWEWITISTSPCPDCEIRAGTVMSFDKWQEIGLPGDGRTICRASCMCKLMPVTVADELFPDIKTFEWDRESGVLTTMGEMRTIGGGQKE